MPGEQAKRWAEPGFLPLRHSRKPCLCNPAWGWGGGGSYPPACSLLLPDHSASASCDLDSLPTCAMVQATLPTCLPLSWQISAPVYCPLLRQQHCCPYGTGRKSFNLSAGDCPSGLAFPPVAIQHDRQDKDMGTEWSNEENPFYWCS